MCLRVRMRVCERVRVCVPALRACLCVRACVCACARARLRGCVRACVGARMCVCVCVHFTGTFRGVAFLSVMSFLARELHGVLYFGLRLLCVALCYKPNYTVCTICALRDLM